MPECPECGTAVTEQHAVCPRCGHDLRTETRSCADCGETIAADADACPVCGALRRPGTCESHGQPAPAQCAVCGRMLCEACDRGRRYHLCEAHGDVSVIEGWAQVYATSDEVEAQLIQENLRADGLEARVLSQKDHYSIPVDIGDLTQIRVLVPVFTYEAAEQIIEDHTDSTGAVRFACPSCGEPYDRGARVCATCGEAVR